MLLPCPGWFTSAGADATYAAVGPGGQLIEVFRQLVAVFSTDLPADTVLHVDSSPYQQTVFWWPLTAAALNGLRCASTDHDAGFESTASTAESSQNLNPPGLIVGSFNSSHRRPLPRRPELSFAAMERSNRRGANSCERPHEHVRPHRGTGHGSGTRLRHPMSPSPLSNRSPSGVSALPRRYWSIRSVCIPADRLLPYASGSSDERSRRTTSVADSWPKSSSPCRSRQPT